MRACRPVGEKDASLFAFRDELTGSDLTVRVAVTDSSVDLGSAQGRPALADQVDRLAERLGARPALMSQVHGAEVAVVASGWPGPVEQGTDPNVPTADALMTTMPGLPLAARAADCVPVLLADPEHGIVAAVHSGRPGLAAGVTTAAVERMRAAGAERITAWIGPHVCGACYEVPEQLRAEVSALVPEAYAQTGWGTPSLDIGRGVAAQLERAGVLDVRTVDRCTREDPALHSYRRDGDRSGRFAGLIWMEPTRRESA